ncbi:Pyruvate decarboxylase isozyme 2, partial [Tetrabaena socialis]
YELQMRYGSIGWSVGAVLGYCCAERQTSPERRVLACIGDGSFQMTAQEVGTMLRLNLHPIILLINNGGYTIEVEIHDGPYNVIKNWDYAAFARALHNGEGRLWTAEARTEPELVAALAEAAKRPDELCFIVAFTHRDDCSARLLEWGSRVAAANSRKPTGPHGCCG